MGEAARHGRVTDGCTAYITMPPCRKCFAALYTAGICRVMSVHKPPAHYEKFQNKIAMEGATNVEEHRARVRAIIEAYKSTTTGSKDDSTSGKKREREESSNDDAGP